jgi:ketosteroid isomerase-like protein
MPARSPEEICDLFQQHMGAGDIESLLSLYDPEAVFLNQSREVKSGSYGLRRELAPMAARKINFTFKINQIIRTGDIALMHTHWTASAPESISVDAIEVARRQPDGTWRWLIGDPFTVGLANSIAFSALGWVAGQLRIQCLESFLELRIPPATAFRSASE